MAWQADQHVLLLRKALETKASISSWDYTHAIAQGKFLEYLGFGCDWRVCSCLKGGINAYWCEWGNYWLRGACFSLLEVAAVPLNDLPIGPRHRIECELLIKALDLAINFVHEVRTTDMKDIMAGRERIYSTPTWLVYGPTSKSV